MGLKWITSTLPGECQCRQPTDTAPIPSGHPVPAADEAAGGCQPAYLAGHLVDQRPQTGSARTRRFPAVHPSRHPAEPDPGPSAAATAAAPQQAPTPPAGPTAGRPADRHGDATGSLEFHHPKPAFQPAQVHHITECPPTECRPGGQRFAVRSDGHSFGARRPEQPRGPRRYWQRAERCHSRSERGEEKIRRHEVCGFLALEKLCFIRY